jgi:hypothetical protein
VTTRAMERMSLEKRFEGVCMGLISKTITCPVTTRAMKRMSLEIDFEGVCVELIKVKQ